MRRRRPDTPPQPERTTDDDDRTRWRLVPYEYEIGRHEDGGNYWGSAAIPPGSTEWDEICAELTAVADELPEAVDLLERLDLIEERGQGWRTSIAWAHDPRSAHQGGNRRR